MEVVPDQRPSRRTRTADELVDQLDRKQNQDSGASAAEDPVELRAGASHDGEDSMRDERALVGFEDAGHTSVEYSEDIPQPHTGNRPVVFEDFARN